MNLQAEFGNIDIYLFDLLLQGKIKPYSKILDIGCGNGRNLFYFLKNNFEVTALDPKAEAIEAVKKMSDSFTRSANLNLINSGLENAALTENHFDLVIANAVLHFANSENHFNDLLNRCWSALAKDGIFFSRLAAIDGLENKVKHKANGVYLLPDGTERYLVTIAQLEKLSAMMNAELVTPIKVTNVQNKRCMATWVLRKK